MIDEEPSQNDSDDDAADRDADKLDARVEQRKRSGHDRRHGELVEHESGSVVHQALALEDRDDAARDVEPGQDRRRRHGVGGRDDGAEHERDGPGEVRHHELQRRAHRERGRNDEADGEQADGADVRPEIAPRGEQRRLVKNGRQHQHEDELRVERKLRQLRQEAERGAADHQRDGIGKIEAARDPAERNRAQQQEQDDFQQIHCASPMKASL